MPQHIYHCQMNKGWLNSGFAFYYFYAVSCFIYSCYPVHIDIYNLDSGWQKIGYLMAYCYYYGEYLHSLFAKQSSKNSSQKEDN